MRILARIICGAALLLAVIVGMYWFSASPRLQAIEASVQPGLPQFSIDHTTYDFGTMLVDEAGTHEFLVTNRGTAPLKIEVTSTTCKCTLLDAPTGEIAPGETQPIKVEWKTKDAIDGFRHGGTITSNDPKNAHVKIFVEGRVRAKVVAYPESVAFSSVMPHESRTGQVAIASHLWSDFTIEPYECTIANVTLSTFDVSPEFSRADEWIKGVRGLQVNLEPGLKVGSHRGVIRYRLIAGAGERREVSLRELPIAIDVVTPFTIHGRAIEGNAMVLGNLPRGKVREEKALLLVRGAPSDFDITEVVTTPEFLKASVQREGASQTGTFRYKVQVTVPADAPLAACVGTAVGRVRLKTNHPDFPEAKFAVEFTVVE